MTEHYGDTSTPCVVCDRTVGAVWSPGAICPRISLGPSPDYDLSTLGTKDFPGLAYKQWEVDRDNAQRDCDAHRIDWRQLALSQRQLLAAIETEFAE